MSPGWLGIWGTRAGEAWLGISFQSYSLLISLSINIYFFSQDNFLNFWEAKIGGLLKWLAKYIGTLVGSTIIKSWRGDRTLGIAE